MGRSWRFWIVAAVFGAAIWACVGSDPDPLAVGTDGGAATSSSSGGSTSSGSSSGNPVIDAGPEFRVTAVADAELVRQGQTLHVTLTRTGGRGKATVKPSLAPAENGISTPAEFTYLEGLPEQKFDIAVSPTALQREYELSFFANDDAQTVGQSTATVKFRVIGVSGGLDEVFGGDAGTKGVLHVEKAVLTSLVVLDDGKIVAAGGNESEFVVVRLGADGQFDPTFGQNGVVRDQVDGGSGIRGIALDGADILAGGGKDNIVVQRYGPSGTPSNVVRAAAPGVTIHDMVLSPDRKLVFAGGASFRKHVAAKFLLNGGPDPTFHGDGLITTQIAPESTIFDDRARRVAAMADGRVVIGGRTFVDDMGDGRLAMFRYVPDGGLDPSFADGGVFVHQFENGYEDEVVALNATADGGLHLVSDQFANDFVITVSRLLPNGAVDPEWWPSSASLTASRPDGGMLAHNATELDGGAWVVAGRSGRYAEPVRAMVAKVSDRAVPDPSFGMKGFVYVDVGAGECEASAARIDAKGYVLVVGSHGANGFITRLFP